MKKQITYSIVFLFAFIFPILASAQWTSYFEDYSFDKITHSTDAYYIIKNTKDSTDTYHAGLLVKVDTFGNEVWRQVYNTPEEDVRFREIVIDHQGNILIGGLQTQSGGNREYPAVFKFNPDGTLIWSKSFHEYASYNDIGRLENIATISMMMASSLLPTPMNMVPQVNLY